MRYRQLGDSGLTVSVVGLGCNQFGSRCGLEQTRAVLDAALDSGITLLDTADVYGNHGGSESLLGEVLQGRRERVLLATKFGGDMGGPRQEARGSRTYISRAIEASLRRLRTDYIDLYQMHVPDPKTPLLETLATLDDLVRDGKVRYIGSSNFAAWQIADSEWLAGTEHRTRFISAQNRYNLLERQVEREVVPACRRYGIGILPYFPLAMGRLTGKYRRGQAPPEDTRLRERPALLNDQVFDAVEDLERYAAGRSRTLLEVAVGGLAAQPAVGSVIAGATRPEQVRANAAAGDWEPSPEDLSALRAVLDRHPSLT